MKPLSELPGRILEKIIFAGTCWLWAASRNQNGYGQVKIDGKPRKAHRVVYEQLVGKVPEDKELDHICRVRNCVNPAHLRAITHLENVRYANKSHCKRGHLLTPENILQTNGQRPKHWRRCKICHSINNRAWEKLKTNFSHRLYQ